MLIRKARWIRNGLLALGLFVGSSTVGAQVREIRSVTPTPSAPTLGTLKLRQAEFEGFRRERIPAMSLGRGGSGDCDEQVGRFCYWYDENEPRPPSEPAEIREARARFIAAVDSSAREYPAERWTSGTLVRYLAEAQRHDEAIKAAERCAGDGWWCPALRGFALHVAGRHAASDSAWSRALAAMDERQRCEWRDLKLLLDDDLLRDYRNINCEQRSVMEQRIWWLSRPMLSSPGNDARAEFLSRRLYAAFLDEAPSVHSLGFDADERELLLRYGWPRAWTSSNVYVAGRGSQRVITGHEPTPAPPMLPMATSVKNPAFSDSLGWRGKGLPGVRARYAPEHARRLLPLAHQSAIFRRGDSAVVVMAYDVASDSALARAALAGDKLSAALVLTRGEEADAAISRLPLPGVRGTLTARTRWEPMLMSAEVADMSGNTLARARYGLRASDTPGSRVSISDLLLFEPWDDMPRTLDDVIPHARASLTVRPGSKVGIYWETYNTNPVGEGIQVAITVAPEQKDGSWLRRGLTALRLVREAQPVSVGISDVSARGLGYSPRAVVVDLATLKPGRYIMQLEITAEGTAPVRAERMLSVGGR
ncbi:MAG: hypothetical protein ACT4P7_00580 [Gemmatimonadaceae bacterium]